MTAYKSTATETGQRLAAIAERAGMLKQTQPEGLDTLSMTEAEPESKTPRPSLSLTESNKQSQSIAGLGRSWPRDVLHAVGEQGQLSKEH